LTQWSKPDRLDRFKITAQQSDGAGMSGVLSRPALAELPLGVSIRIAFSDDLGSLADYFESLSESSRYARFMGSVGSFSVVAFECLIRGCRAERFTLVAEVEEPSGVAMIAEASYAFYRDKNCGEFAISVSDRWQNRGLGTAMLCELQSRAVSLGFFDLFGETLKTNDRMKAFARKAGFEFTRSSDWRAVRFDKRLTGPASIS
jgi:RimJ/RimL family protein N-acetyltransferase